MSFQKVGQEHNHAADQFALFAFTHVLNLLGDVHPTQLIKTSRLDELGLLIGSSHYIGVVTRFDAAFNQIYL